MSDFPATGRLAGIDFGTVRIGVALCDAHQTLASPHAIYTRRSARQDAVFFHQLVAEQDVVGFVVGLPLHLSGQESAKSREVRQFADWLAEVTGRPVRLWDERFTTRDAESLLGVGQLTRKQRQARRDKVAAQLLLSDYLSATRREDFPAALDDG
ncbi:MAG: Holliday junction resolvase RuvX [Pirellulaceae bacterium]|jgi:putative Holliday junction resolvase|nr:Holliday junction resolvase RuvX [Pirellulaceae bacterium]